MDTMQAAGLVKNLTEAFDALRIARADASRNPPLLSRLLAVESRVEVLIGDVMREYAANPVEESADAAE